VPIINIDLPDSIHKNLRRIADEEGISIDQLIATAVAEKISALETEEYLNARAARASREAFEQALKSAPDITPPLEADRR
jgi:antitoxin component of RelBE/YafQ-DinJ toxin-antitoxin module